MQHFDKYHGLGNDFVLMHRDDPDAAVDLDGVVAACDRHRGIGADGVILFSPIDERGHARMVIYNADGTRPQMCGNGVRCVVARMADAAWLTLEDAEVVIDSDAGPRPCRLVGGARGAWDVAVNMGEAIIEQGRGDLIVDGTPRPFTDVNMGNPHAVLFHQPDDLAEIDRVGKRCNADAQTFPEGVNVEFVRVVEEHILDVIVYERGVGRTQACGTGACAVAAAAWSTDLVGQGEPLEVRLPGGALHIEEIAGSLWMTGPATLVFSGALPEELV